MRIRIARAEVKRAGGIAELTDLATKADAHTRQLALRGLGRIGGAGPTKTLLAAIADPDVAEAAYAALGVAASLDDTSPLEGHAVPTPSVAIIEAFGRAAGQKEQALIAVAVRDKPAALVAEAALAFARMSRRKILLAPVARDWLVAKTKDPDRGVRYAATYALAREFQPAPSPSAIAALTARVTDDDPETRAAAIAALTKRDSVTAAAIAESLRDRDWRVAVEAVRALGKGSATQRDLLATNLARRFTELGNGHGGEAQVLTESLRTIIQHPELTPTGSGALAEFAGRVIGGGVAERDGISPLAGAWLAFELGVATTALSNSVFTQLFSDGPLPQHLRFTVAEDAFAHGDTAFQRALLRAMLESSDPRERADGLGVLASADPKAVDRSMVVSSLAAAVAAKDPVISGAAADAIGSYYKANGTEPTLDAALVARAAIETEPELASGLYETIGTYKIAGGAAACRSGLDKHPVAARAAATCLKALGQAVPDPEIGIGVAPPVDVATVIGKHITWHVVTTTGPIDIELRPDIAPWNVAVIVALTQRGFYTNIEFHRVVPNFVVQGGDPTMSGVGGPGYTTPAEPATELDGPGFATGGIGIADAGRDSGGSQWFAMHSRAPHLDGRYTYIGKIVSGQSSADSLLIGDRVLSATVDVK